MKSKHIKVSVILATILMISGCSGSSDTPDTLTKKYLTTGSIKKAASFILESQKDEFLSYYSNFPNINEELQYSSDMARAHINDLILTNLDDAGDCKVGEYVRVRMTFKGGSSVGIRYWKKTKGGFQYDWESSSGYNELSMKQYALSGDRSPHIFRVTAYLADEYCREFGKAKKTHYSVQMYDPLDEDSESFLGFVEKSSDLGKQIYELLNDVEFSNKISVEISIPTGIETGHNIAVIDKLISDSWLIKE